ncbi:hypothetical protein PG995_007493 [Apiospora arundinis]
MCLVLIVIITISSKPTLPHHGLRTRPLINLAPLPLPFLKSTNNSPAWTSRPNNTYCCSLRQAVYLTALLLAFAAGVAAGHLYWRRVRSWTRRTHARAHQWTSSKRDEIVGCWERVVGRVEGAVAGWNNGMRGGTFKEKDEPSVGTGEAPSSSQSFDPGSGKRKEKQFVPGHRGRPRN